MNKHDELLRKIENTPEDENLYWIDQLKEHEFVCTTDELQSLAADFRKMREMLDDSALFQFSYGEVYFGPIRERWKVRGRKVWFDSPIEAYAALKARQSGEEGE